MDPCDTLDRTPETSQKAGTFVLVTDHHLMRHWLRESLRSNADYRVVAECGTVVDAVEACLEHYPSIAIVAWNLPDGRGSDLIRAIRVRSPRTKFLFLAADPRPHVVRQAFYAGGEGCLFPEATYEMFEQAVTALLNDRTYYCPQASRLLVEAMRMNQRPTSEGLSSSDREILTGVASSEPMKSVADRLGLSPKTVSNRLSQLKFRLHIEDAAGLVRYAIQTGLVERPGV